ncbi:MAG: DUF2892 domain-containing protein [Methylocystaceae bacterium]|nr:MAG: DUF2892 domain-containing protein [Methylocystaceae bacterium]
MFYVNNLPNSERVLRAVGGIVAGAAAVAYLGATPAGYAVGAIGAMIALTGFVGFCPACAMVGRKLTK